MTLEVETKVIKGIVRDMLASHDLEAVLGIRDKASGELLYEINLGHVERDMILTVKHTVGAVEVVQV